MQQNLPKSASWSFGDIPSRQATRRDTPQPTQEATLRSGSGRLRGLDPQTALAQQFEILGTLGQGGMGVVYRGRDGAGREVAIKVVSGNLNARQRERFQREGQLTAALQHPGIVRVHSGGEIEGVPFLAYELIPGGRTYADVMEDGQLDRSGHVRLLLEVARALAFAHEQGVVHRDVKPENVLVDPEGRPHVADFGLAWTASAQTLTQSGAMVGTPSYMSPEQVAGPSHDVLGPPTDVWALGVMLYEALTGRRPFDGSSLLELSAKIRHLDPEPPRELDPTIDPALEAMCLKALAKEPGERYADAGALVSDLEAALGAGSGNVSALAERVGSARAARLRRTFASLLTLCALLLAALSGLVLTQGSRAASRLTQRIEAAEGDPAARPALEAALAETPAELVEPSLFARAHLVLANGAAPDERLRYAERAAACDPENAEAHAAVGAACVALGRDQQGAAAYERAFARSTDPAHLGEQVSALLRSGDAERAVALLTASEAKSLQPLLVDACIRAGQLEAAREALEQLAPGLETESLRARLVQAEGNDPRAILRTASSESGDAGAVVLYARWLWLDQLAPAAALQVVRAARQRSRSHAPELEQLEAALRVCSRPPAQPPTLDTVGADLAQGCLQVGLRELAYVARLRDNRHRAGPGALSVEEREARARAWLTEALRGPDPRLRARAHAALARLEGADGEHLDRAAAILPNDPDVRTLLAARDLEAGEAQACLDHLSGIDGDRADLLRGRAMVALGRASEAVEVLSTAAGDPPIWLPATRELAAALQAAGQSERAAALATRIRLLAAPKIAEADEAIERLRGDRSLRRSPPGSMERAIRTQIFPLDPQSAEALALLEYTRYVHGDRAALLRLFEHVSRRPENLGRASAPIFGISQGAITNLVSSRSLGQLARAPLPSDPTPLQRLRRALLLTWTMEYEGVGELNDRALFELSDCLRRDPSESLAWTLRGFAHVRAGFLEQAELDLDIAAEYAVSGSLVFYRALLAAARNDPVKVVRRALQETRMHSYKAWGEDGWTQELYPEFDAYPRKHELMPFWEQIR